LDSKDDKTWQALRLLLDDESAVVRERLVNWFHTHRERAIPYLQEWTCDLDRGVASEASRYLQGLVQEDPVADFSLFIESQRYELETGIVLLNRTVSPHVTVEFCAGELNQSAARSRDLLVSHHPPREVCKVISRVLFHEEGFRSNVEEDHHPANSLLREVLVS